MHWIMLTTTDHRPIRVNMGQVAFMQENNQGQTELYFATGDDPVMRTVEENMDRIRILMNP